MAESVNFKVIQGDSFILHADYKDPSGTPIDLSDFEVVFRVRDQFGGKVICATASKDSGITSEDWEQGHFRVELTPTQTKKFTIPTASYQLQIVSTGGIRTTLASGIFSVEKGNI